MKEKTLALLVALSLVAVGTLAVVGTQTNFPESYTAGTAGTMTIDEWRNRLSDKIVRCSAMPDVNDLEGPEYGYPRDVWCVGIYGSVSYVSDYGGDTYYIDMDGRCCGKISPMSPCWTFSKNGPTTVSSIPEDIADAAWDKLQKYIEEQRTKKLNVDIDGNGEVEYYPSYEDDYYSDGTVITLTAEPDKYWLFDHWQGDLSGANKNKTLVMDSDKTVTAVFVPKELAVLVSPEDGEEILVELPTTDMIQLVADVDVPDVYNPRVRLYAKKNGEETWHFDGSPLPGEQRMTWSIMIGSSGTAPRELYVEPGDTIEWWVEVANGAPYNNVLDLSRHRTFSVVQGQPTEYELTVSVEGNGDVIIEPDTIDNLYREGETVRLTANPDPGYSFDHWEGDVASSLYLASASNNPLTITMDRDRSITAYFVENTTDTYTLTVNSDPSNGGTVQKSTDGAYNPGETVTLTATPEPGYRFTGWSGDASGSSQSTTITMNSDKTVTAEFTSGEGDNLILWITMGAVGLLAASLFIFLIYRRRKR